MSQSTIKMEKGYYVINYFNLFELGDAVAIHNKNGKGLLRENYGDAYHSVNSRNPQ